MSQTSTRQPLYRPRLVRFISELSVADQAVSHKHFAERLGQLFDLSDSIAISAAHGRRKKQQPGPAPGSREVAKETFLRGRGAIVRAALRGFAKDTTARIRFPVIGVDVPLAESMEAEPYLAFYAAQQQEAEFRVRKLQLEVRKAVAQCSPELAGLCALDTVLGDSLASRRRRCFTAVPQLLQQRFTNLLEACQLAGAEQQEERDLWLTSLARFHDEMQGTLLAEIDARLLPVTGLIEALDEHSDKESYD